MSRAPGAEPPDLSLPAPALSRRVRRRLLAWFAGAQRPLPWRVGYDPYAVWVSEMMLQQTQVETVLPYYERWMARFPDLAALAAAPQEAVLKAWEGLGYYARARNLHRAAQEVVARHGGRLPADPEALEALPGIGPYSAGAISSIAFNLPRAAVDGNVARVLSRLFALEGASQSGAGGGRARLWRLAQALIPRGRGREFNQGLMELGALVCRPVEPLCGLCPLREDCRAFALGDPGRFPVRAPRPARPTVRALLAVLHRRGALLVRHRPPRGLWGGLWEFPWAEADGAAPAGAWAGLLGTLGLRPAGPARPLGGVRHGLTHREFVWVCLYGAARAAGKPAPTDESDELRWADPAALAALPLTRPARKVLALVDAVAPASGRSRGDPRPMVRRRA